MTPAPQLHPIGARVRLRSDPQREMLIVDMDVERGTRIAAWKAGAAVSEQEYQVEQLEGPVTA